MAAKSRKSSLLPALKAAAGILFCLLLWEGLVRVSGVKPVTMPPASAVMVEIYQDFGWYAGHAWFTVLTTIGGFAVAVVVGIAVAVMIVSSRFFEETFYPAIVALNNVPKVAVAPLFVIWLGTGAEPKIAVGFLIAVFPIIVNTVLGLRSVPSDILDLAKVLNGSPVKTFLKIRFPIALPHIFSGMKVAVSLALVGAIVGEFVSSQKGLGYVILSSQGTFDTARVFAALIILGVIGIVMFWALNAIERVSIPWHSSRME